MKSVRLVPPSGFPDGLSQPALRALAGAGISSLNDLAKMTEAELAAFHGMGSSGLAKIKSIMQRDGVSFKKADNVNTFTINQDRWAKFSFDEQMGNIGSEVGRAFKAKKAGDSERQYGAMVRGLALFNATIQIFTKQKSPRAKEVLRARDQFLTILTDENATNEQMDSLETYFMRFALTARSKK